MKKIAIQRVVTVLFLVLFFISSFSGAAEAILCIDQEEVHVLGQERFETTACHTPAENNSREGASQVSGENHLSPCVDIRLSTDYRSVNLSVLKKFNPEKRGSKVPRLLHIELSNVSMNDSSSCFSASPHDSLSTVVLLI